MDAPDTETVDRLERAGVLRDASEVVELTPEFAERSEALIAETGDVEADALEPHVDLSGRPRWFRRSIVGYLAALRAFDVDLPEPRLVAVARSLARLEEQAPEAEARTPFFALDGEEVEGFVEDNDRALLLVTRPDCEPCDRVKAKLMDLIEEGDVPADLPLAEVSGPDNRHLLFEEYDVVGAPTLLFCRDGRVELRLVGDNHLEQLRRDVAKVYPELS